MAGFLCFKCNLRCPNLAKNRGLERFWRVILENIRLLLFTVILTWFIIIRTIILKGAKLRTKRAANPRQDSILVFIREYYQDHRIAPNIREISSACNITSTSVTNYYLDKLEDEGMIERIAKISRGIKLTDRGMKYAMMLSGVDTNCTCYLCGAPINQNGIYDPDLNENQNSEKKNKQRLKNIPAGVKINHRAGTVN